MLTLTPDDVNMHKVLQMSTCKHGQRRRVAKRCLTALGGVSGLCGFLNDEDQVEVFIICFHLYLYLYLFWLCRTDVLSGN